MENHIPECALLELLITLPVEAAHKTHAKEVAELTLNGKTVRLDRITLTDVKGNTYPFAVKSIKYIQWFHVQPSEFSRRFKVNGRMELVLAEFPEAEGKGGTPRCTNLYLGSSRFLSKPVLIIPTRKEPAVVQVNRQLLKWMPEVKGTAALLRTR
jgi:hypothetical protein